MVSPAGFEPATCPLGGGRAIQLCHGDQDLLSILLIASMARHLSFFCTPTPRSMASCSALALISHSEKYSSHPAELGYSEAVGCSQNLKIGAALKMQPAAPAHHHIFLRSSRSALVSMR